MGYGNTKHTLYLNGKQLYIRDLKKERFSIEYREFCTFSKAKEKNQFPTQMNKI